MTVRSWLLWYGTVMKLRGAMQRAMPLQLLRPRDVDASILTHNLISPETGAHVHLIGSLLNIPSMAPQVGDFIRRQYPQQVILELDERELLDIHKNIRRGSEQPGYDMYMAMMAANEVNATVIPGDYGRTAYHAMSKHAHRVDGKRLKKLKEEEFISVAKQLDAAIAVIPYAVTVGNLKQIRGVLDVFREASPEYMHCLTTMRETYLLRELRLARGPIVCGVVGKFYMPGIIDRWNEELPDIPADFGNHKPGWFVRWAINTLNRELKLTTQQAPTPSPPRSSLSKPRSSSSATAGASSSKPPPSSSSSPSAAAGGGASSPKPPPSLSSTPPPPSSKS